MNREEVVKIRDREKQSLASMEQQFKQLAERIALVKGAIMGYNEIIQTIDNEEKQQVVTNESDEVKSTEQQDS